MAGLLDALGIADTDEGVFSQRARRRHRTHRRRFCGALTGMLVFGRLFGRERKDTGT